MPGGPIFPYSVDLRTEGKLFDSVAVSGSRYDRGIGVMASLDGNAEVELRFLLPEIIPSGTCKLLLSAQANATSGVAKVNPSWALDAAEDIPGDSTLTAEGTSTITWSSGDAYAYKELAITLDGSESIGSGDERKRLVMKLTFETSSWTLAAVSTWMMPALIWE